MQKSCFGRFAEILLRRSDEVHSSVCIDIFCATLADRVLHACSTPASWFNFRADVRERLVVGFPELLWLGFLVLTVEVLMPFSLFEVDGSPI